MIFHWAQAEVLSSHADRALRLLHKARALSLAAAGKWPDLDRWCADLIARIEPLQSALP